MIGDEESGGRECARIARPLSHPRLNLHPFSGRGGAKRRSAVGRWTGVVFRCLRSRGFERAEGFTYHQEKWPAAQCDVYVISTGGHYHEFRYRRFLHRECSRERRFKRDSFRPRPRHGPHHGPFQGSRAPRYFIQEHITGHRDDIRGSRRHCGDPKRRRHYVCA